MPIVSIVIPTRNESANIANLLNQVKPLGHEILVVDDSTDGGETKMLAIKNGARVLDGQHKGLGQAIIDGIKASKSEIVVVMDADCSHPPSKIPQLVEACKDGYGMSIGSRYVNGGSIVGWNKKRRLISMVASRMAFPITGLRDNTSGFFAVSNSILDGVDLKPDSWKIMLEILVKSKAKAVEIPIEFWDRQAGESKFNNKEVVAYLKHLFKLAMFKYRVFSFTLVGGIGFIINMGLYYPLTLIFQSEVTFLDQHFYLPPFAISSAVAIMSNYHFNKVWTFGDRKAKSLSSMRYFGMAGITLLLDMFVLFLMVDYGHLHPMLAAMVAIIFVFFLRYVIADKWIWGYRKSA